MIGKPWKLDAAVFSNFDDHRKISELKAFPAFVTLSLTRRFGCPPINEPLSVGFEKLSRWRTSLLLESQTLRILRSVN